MIKSTFKKRSSSLSFVLNPNRETLRTHPNSHPTSKDYSSCLNWQISRATGQHPRILFCRLWLAFSNEHAVKIRDISGACGQDHLPDTFQPSLSSINFHALITNSSHKLGKIHQLFDRRD